MKNIGKFIFTICLLLMLIINLGSLFASETRVASMGNTGLFTHDNSNIQLFPAGLLLYRNQIITELRVKNNENSFTAGVHLPLGNNAVGGVYLNRNLNLPVPRGLVTSIEPLQANDLVMSMALGEQQLGLRLTLAYEENKQTAPDTASESIDETAQYIEFAGGVSSDYYDFGAYFGLPVFENNSPGRNDKWSGTGFGVSGRFFLGPPGAIKYVPVVLINQLSADLERNTVDTSTDLLEFRMGVGVHYQVDDNNLAILGVEIFGTEQRENDTAGIGKETIRITNLPAFYLGGETYAKKWLILRLGATFASREVRTTLRPAGGQKIENTLRDSQFNFSVGAGVQIGGFLLDLDINDNFLFEGPDFISGQGSSEINDFINRLSITYTF